METAVLQKSKSISKTTPIRVLVVDDSTFIRNAISSMLAKSPEIDVVGCARNGADALQKVRELNPDVMTLDIEMPGMNGLQVLERVMQEYPLPVIVVSSHTEESAKVTLQALELGAVDFISKQLNGSVLEISKIERLLVAKVKTASYSTDKVKNLLKSRPERGATRLSTKPHELEERAQPGKSRKVVSSTTHDPLVIIGSSTGGPKVVQEILTDFPSAFPCAIIVVQHMPKFFTKPFADRLNELCSLNVREANDGDLVRSGQVLVAPGGQHLRLEEKSDRAVCVRVSTEPANLPYRPSVDFAMQSAAEIYRTSLIGVVLTGMGNDGEQGMKSVKGKGGRTLAQNEATCIVYGMPKAVIDAGHADAVVPVSRMSQEIMTLVQ